MAKTKAEEEKKGFMSRKAKNNSLTPLDDGIELSTESQKERMNVCLIIIAFVLSISCIIMIFASKTSIHIKSKASQLDYTTYHNLDSQKRKEFDNF